MKTKDIKIGMRVTPFQKTVKKYEENIDQYKRHKYGSGLFLNFNNYLFVVDYDEDTKAWVLGENIKSNCGDCFNAEDFEPYQEKENGFEIKCLDCGYIGCDLNVVYHGFQFSCSNCGQVYKQ